MPLLIGLYAVASVGCLALFCRALATKPPHRLVIAALTVCTFAFTELVSLEASGLTRGQHISLLGFAICLGALAYEAALAMRHKQAEPPRVA